MSKQLPMTARQQRWKRKSKSSASSKKPESAKTSTAEPESLVSVQPLNNWFSTVKASPRRSRLDDRDDPHHCMTCIAHETYNVLFTLLSTICHRAHIDQSATLLLGWRRVWNQWEEAADGFFSSRLLPHSPTPPSLAFSSPPCPSDP